MSRDESRWVVVPSEDGVTSSDSQGMAYMPDRISGTISTKSTDIHSITSVRTKTRYVWQAGRAAIEQNMRITVLRK